VHLVGFIIRIYHDARSPDRQKKCGHLDVPTEHRVNCSEYPLAWGVGEPQCQTEQFVGGKRKRLDPDGNRITTSRLASHSLGIRELHS